MLGADTFCARIGNQDGTRGTHGGHHFEERTEAASRLGQENLFLLTGGGHIEVWCRQVLRPHRKPRRNTRNPRRASLRRTNRGGKPPRTGKSFSLDGRGSYRS